MKAQGIKRVLCLLSPAELQFYEQPLVPSLEAAFPAGVAVVSVGDADSRRQCLQALSEAEKAGESIVVFCSTVRKLSAT
jgi:hypothetical protein